MEKDNVIFAMQCSDEEWETLTKLRGFVRKIPVVTDYKFAESKKKLTSEEDRKKVWEDWKPTTKIGKELKECDPEACAAESAQHRMHKLREDVDAKWAAHRARTRVAESRTIQDAAFIPGRDKDGNLVNVKSRHEDPGSPCKVRPPSVAQIVVANLKNRGELTFNGLCDIVKSSLPKMKESSLRACVSKVISHTPKKYGVSIYRDECDRVYIETE